MKITVRAELDFDSIEHLCIDDFDGNKYIEGIGFKANNTLIVLENGDEFSIKPNTRSINLDDMLDSQGNKIFASLSEDGKGGDILYWHNMTDEPDCSPSTVIFINNRIECFKEYLCDLDIDAMIIVGVQK